VKTEPVKVYLDSSDYSTLSAPDLGTSDAAVRDRLIHWVRKGSIRCYFSHVLLAEMAPTTPGREDHAVARAALLFDLCRANTMIAPQRLMTMELARAISIEYSATSAYSTDGQWFPDGGDELPAPATRDELSAQIQDCATELFQESQLNRAQRRQAQKRLRTQRTFVHQRVRERARTLTLSEEQARQSLNGYPLKAEDVVVLMRYYAGHGTEEAAQVAYRRSLSDPKWILEWMYRDVDRSREFADWLRAPGEDLSRQLMRSVGLADDLRALSDSSIGREFLSNDAWRARIDDSMARVCTTIATKFLGHEGQVSAKLIETKCPGTHAMLGTFYSAWRAAVEHNRKAPMRSDYGDALHAIYAPYVDVFRADSSMAPHVARHVSGNICVVQKLRNLIPTIEQLL